MSALSPPTEEAVVVVGGGPGGPMQGYRAVVLEKIPAAPDL